MKKWSAQMSFGKLLAVVVAGLALTACSPKQQVQQNAMTQGGALAIASGPAGAQSVQSTSAENATVFGRITDDDWYMIAAGTHGVKPLVIWARSRSECEASAAEFNLKSVDPARPGEPAKAWCAQGRDLRSQLRLPR